MPLVDPGYFIPSGTWLYTAPVDEPAPEAGTLLTGPGGRWELRGHVGNEEGDGNVAFTRDGGDVTTKGSMSKRAIRQVVEPVSTGFEVDLTQFTRGVLELYIGTSGGSVSGRLQVEGPYDGIVTETAALVVWADGGNNAAVGLYAPRVGWSGRDNIETESVEDAVAIPLKAGFLDSDTIKGPNGLPLRYTWISPNLMVTS